MSDPLTVKDEFEEYRSSLIRLKDRLETLSPTTTIGAVSAHANVMGNIAVALSTLSQHDPEKINLTTLVDIADISQAAINSATEYLTGRY